MYASTLKDLKSEAGVLVFIQSTPSKPLGTIPEVALKRTTVSNRFVWPLHADDLDIAAEEREVWDRLDGC